MWCSSGSVQWVYLRCFAENSWLPLLLETTLMKAVRVNQSSEDAGPTWKMLKCFIELRETVELVDNSVRVCQYKHLLFISYVDVCSWVSCGSDSYKLQPQCSIFLCSSIYSEQDRMLHTINLEAPHPRPRSVWSALWTILAWLHGQKTMALPKPPPPLHFLTSTHIQIQPLVFQLICVLTHNHFTWHYMM